MSETKGPVSEALEEKIINNKKTDPKIEIEFPEEMSKPQRKYALKKAEYEELAEIATQETERVLEKLDQELDDETEVLIGDKIEEELGVHDAWDEYQEAEIEMVKWCFKRIGKDKIPEDIRDKWNKFPHIKKKVVDTAFHFNPNKGDA